MAQLKDTDLLYELDSLGAMTRWSVRTWTRP